MGYLELVALWVIVIPILWKQLMVLTWRPYVITRKMKKQGVRGPGYRFWSGSLEEIRILKKETREIEMNTHSHDITPRVLPHYYKWMNEYGMFYQTTTYIQFFCLFFPGSFVHTMLHTPGGTFLYWMGSKPRVCITDAEHVKQVLSNKFGFYPKPKPSGLELAILGRGLFTIDGSDWARHRRIVSPAFTMDKLKVCFLRFKYLRLSLMDIVSEVQSSLDSTNI